MNQKSNKKSDDTPNVIGDSDSSDAQSDGEILSSDEELLEARRSCREYKAEMVRVETEAGEGDETNFVDGDVGDDNTKGVEGDVEGAGQGEEVEETGNEGDDEGAEGVETGGDKSAEGVEAEGDRLVNEVMEEVDRNNEGDNVSDSDDDSDWHSEYEVSDVLRSPSESSEDEDLGFVGPLVKKKKPLHCDVFNPKTKKKHKVCTLSNFY